MENIINPTQILEGLGGKSNIDSLTNCATRLRLELKDNTIIDEQKLEMLERWGDEKWPPFNTSNYWYTCSTGSR